jgi:hypothetical protein
MGMVVDTIVLTTTLLVASLQVKSKGRKLHTNMRIQIYASALGHCLYKRTLVESADCRQYSLLTTGELEDKYHDMRGSTPKPEWNAGDLTTEILRSVDTSVSNRQLNNMKGPLEEDVKDHC